MQSTFLKEVDKVRKKDALSPSSKFLYLVHDQSIMGKERFKRFVAIIGVFTFALDISMDVCMEWIQIVQNLSQKTVFSRGIFYLFAGLVERIL